MPTNVYARASAAGDGYSLSYELLGPGVLHPDGRGAKDVQQAERAAVTKAARLGKSQAIAAYSPPTIRKGWRSKTEVGAFLRITIANPERLALWVEEATKAHRIVVRGYNPATGHPLQALHWGGTHFAHSVQHPGTKGKHRVPGLLAQLGRTFEAQLLTTVEPLLRDEVHYIGLSFESFDG